MILYVIYWGCDCVFPCYKRIGMDQQCNYARLARLAHHYCRCYAVIPNKHTSSECLFFGFWWVIPCFWASNFVLRELLVYINIMSLHPSKLDLTSHQPKKIPTKRIKKVVCMGKRPCFKFFQVVEISQFFPRVGWSMVAYNPLQFYFFVCKLCRWRWRRTRPGGMIDGWRGRIW